MPARLSGPGTIRMNMAGQPGHSGLLYTSGGTTRMHGHTAWTGRSMTGLAITGTLPAVTSDRSSSIPGSPGFGPGSRLYPVYRPGIDPGYENPAFVRGSRSYPVYRPGTDPYCQNPGLVPGSGSYPV